MMQKLLISLVLLSFLVVTTGFVVIAVWDVPVTKKEIEKPVDTSRLLEKKS